VRSRRLPRTAPRAVARRTRARRDRPGRGNDPGRGTDEPEQGRPRRRETPRAAPARAIDEGCARVERIERGHGVDEAFGLVKDVIRYTFCYRDDMYSCLR
jgi:hypothetical protein